MDPFYFEIGLLIALGFWLLARPPRSDEATRIELLIISRKGSSLNALKLKQSATVSLNAYDQDGNTGAVLAASPVWNSTDPNVVSLNVAPGGTSCVVEAVHIGTAKVQVTVPGTALNAELDFQVSAGDATRIDLTIVAA